MLISRSNLAAVGAASKDPNDSRLTGLHVARDGSTVATDGRIVVAVGPAPDVQFPNLGEPFIVSESGIRLSNETVAIVGRNIPKGKTVGQLQYAALTRPANPHHVELATTDHRRVQRVEDEVTADVYPKWEEATRLKRGPVRLCLDRNVLARLLQVLDEAASPHTGSGDARLFLEIADQQGFVARCVNPETGQRVIGVIGGYKSEKWPELDSWEEGVFQEEPVEVVKKEVDHANEKRNPASSAKNASKHHR